MPAPRTESRHPEADGLHERSNHEILTVMARAQQSALESLYPVLPEIEKAALAAAAAIGSGGRLGYAGAGSSGLMAMADALELAGTFGIPPEQSPVLFAGGAAALLHMRGAVEDDREAALRDLEHSSLGAGDVLIALSASGTTPYALSVGEAAKVKGVTLVGIANVAGAPLLSMADIAIHLDTPPEVIAGSTRLGAATAQKAALNLISVLMGTRLGHVHDGYMVNVVADNLKLVARATRIVAAIAGTEDDKAEAALATAKGRVKLAVLLASGMELATAEEALRHHKDQLAPILAQVKR